MIRINRIKCPIGLKRGSAIRYNKANVVLALFNMQHGKCCYCEQIIPVEGHGKAVEHFRPKGIFKRLLNSWGNLLLACAQCNGRKSDQFPTALTANLNHPKVLCHTRRKRQPLLINPSDPGDLNPEDHIAFNVDDGSEEFGLCSARGGSARGEATVTITGIHRPFFVLHRRIHLRGLLLKWVNLLEAYDHSDFEMVRQWRDSIKQSTRENAPFAALSREFVRVKRLEERFGHL